jgi:hypothetical protein
MKRITLMLKNRFMNIDFSNAIADAVREYNGQCGYKLNEQPVKPVTGEKKDENGVRSNQNIAIAINQSR